MFKEKKGPYFLELHTETFMGGMIWYLQHASKYSKSRVWGE